MAISGIENWYCRLVIAYQIFICSCKSQIWHCFESFFFRKIIKMAPTNHQIAKCFFFDSLRLKINVYHRNLGVKLHNSYVHYCCLDVMLTAFVLVKFEHPLVPPDMLHDNNLLIGLFTYKFSGRLSKISERLMRKLQQVCC